MYWYRFYTDFIKQPMHPISINNSRTSSKKVLQSDRDLAVSFSACERPSQGHQMSFNTEKQIVQPLIKVPLRGKLLIAFLNSKNITFSIKVSLTKWRKIIHGHAEPETDFPKTFFLTDPKLYLNKDQHDIKKKTRWRLLPEKACSNNILGKYSVLWHDLTIPHKHPSFLSRAFCKSKQPSQRVFIWLELYRRQITSPEFNLHVTVDWTEGSSVSFVVNCFCSLQVKTEEGRRKTVQMKSQTNPANGTGGVQEGWRWTAARSPPWAPVTSHLRRAVCGKADFLTMRGCPTKVSEFQSHLHDFFLGGGHISRYYMKY